MSHGKYVYSTLTAPMRYTLWDRPSENSLPVAKSSVLIQGGANLAPKTLVTPKGVVTPITDEQYEMLLKGCPSFKRHMKRGFIQVEDRNAPIEEVVSDMEPKDASAPKTPEDYGDNPPTTGTAEAAPDPQSAVGADQAPTKPRKRRARTEDASDKPKRRGRGRPTNAERAEREKAAAEEVAEDAGE